MENQPWENLLKTEYSRGGIISRVIQKKDGMDVTLFKMSADTKIAEHTTTREGFIYVIEGKGIFCLEGKNIPMETGVFIPLGKNMKHSLGAEDNTSFLLILFKN